MLVLVANSALKWDRSRGKVKWSSSAALQQQTEARLQLLNINQSVSINGHSRFVDCAVTRDCHYLDT
jgi:hypothetical protein